MKILIACEESQAVCTEMRRLGHEAYSCDIEPCSGGHPEWHIQADALEIIKIQWDMIIAHPPCTHLAVSGSRWFTEGRKPRYLQDDAADFFMRFIETDSPRIAVENPVSVMSTRYRKPDQIIHPWQFGHSEEKTTCLWLKGLPKLVPTNVVDKGINTLYRLPPSADRAKLRSKTFPGIARAMAEQWAGPCMGGSQ